MVVSRAAAAEFYFYRRPAEMTDQLDATVLAFVRATDRVERAEAEAAAARRVPRQDRKLEQDRLRSLMMEQAVPRVEVEDATGQVHTLQLRDTASMRTPAPQDLAHELTVALLSPFDAEVVAGHAPDGAVVPGVQVPFDEAVGHLARRAVDSLKPRFVRHNTTLSIRRGRVRARADKADKADKAGADEPARAARAAPVAPSAAVVDALQACFRRYKAAEGVVAQTVAQYEPHVKRARAELDNQQPRLRALIAQHAPETLSVPVPPASSTAAPRAAHAVPTAPAVPARSVPPPPPPPPTTRPSLSGHPPRADRGSRPPSPAPPVSHAASRPPSPAAPATAAMPSHPSSRPPSPAAPDSPDSTDATVGQRSQPSRSPRYVCAKQKTTSSRLNFADLATVLESVLTMIAEERGMDSSRDVAVDDLARVVLAVPQRILPIVVREVDAARQTKSTRTDVVTVDRVRHRR